MKKTKIIATIGENNNSVNYISDMIKEGVDVFRINLSYVSLDLCDNIIANIKEASKKLHKIIGIMLDLDGPSVRIDKLKEDIYLEIDKEIRIYDYHVVCNNTQLSTNCDNLTELVKPDDIISIGAGDVKLQVKEINNDNFIATVVDPGLIRSNNTIHIEKYFLNT